MVLTEHKKFYDEIFRIDGFLNSPFLMFGFQELSKGFDPRLKEAKSFKGLLHLMGVKDVTVLDYEDKRADVHFDMNYPLNNRTERKTIGDYGVVADIGCLEHVFNSAQAMKNCMDVVKVGGLYFLHTPVAGYCKHGFHTFNNKMLQWVLENNGFEIEYKKYSNQQGVSRLSPSFGAHNDNVLIWLVARRKEVSNKFHMPVQERQSIKESYRTATYPWNDERTVPAQSAETVAKEYELVEKKEMTEIGDWDMSPQERAQAGEKLKTSMMGNVLVDQSDKGEDECTSPFTSDGNIPIQGYIGEGHDPVDLSNQNLSL